MRLAFLTSLIPVAKPDTGFEIANAAVLDALRSAGHDVVAIGFTRPGEAPADAGRAVVLAAEPIENAAVPLSARLRWLAAAMRLGLPVACAKLRLAGEGRLIEALRAHGPFDGLVLNSVMLPGAFPELLDIAPAILVEHNIEHVSARQAASHARSLPMRWLYAREARLLEAIERRLWSEARFVWTLAEEDRAALGDEAAPRSAVLPLVPANPPDATPAASEARWDVGLIGTWTWTPNRIGLDWFLDEVVPLLPTGMRIAVAGRLPDGMAAPAGVTLLGRVPDAAAFALSCRCIALSSRAGTGVQLKTVEAMALGLPAVATALSCRGFTEMPTNFALADDPAAFAKALVGHVEAVRDGRLGRIDGAAFLDGQRAALNQEIRRGLAALG